MSKVIMLLIIMALTFLSGCVSDEELSYYGEEIPPYSYTEDGAAVGICVDLIGEVSGGSVEMGAWDVIYNKGVSEENVVICAMVRSAQRDPLFKWAGPIHTDRHVLFAQRNFEFSGDLDDYRIGVISSDSGEEQLRGMGVRELVEFESVEGMIGAMESGEIDLWCYQEAAGRHFSKEVMGSAYYYRVVEELEEVEVYVAFSKDVRDEVVLEFQDEIDSLKESGEYEVILGRYLPEVGLSQLTFLTEEFAPVNYVEDGEPAGISVDILEAIFEDVGASGAQVRVVDWEDGYEAVMNNDSTVLFSMART